MLNKKAGGSSQSTEATLFQQAQSGNQESLNWLLAQHEGLVHYAVGRQELYGLPYEEALQAGRRGLWRAILGFDVERGVQFSTYAYQAIIRYVWAEIRHFFRSQHRQVSRSILQLYFCEPGMDPAWLREWEDICQSLESLVDRLPHPQVDMIRLHYGLGGQIPLTHAEVAVQIRVSPQRVGQIEREALMWLRQPAHSQELRSLLARHTQQQYELVDQLAQVYLRRKGRRHERL